MSEAAQERKRSRITSPEQLHDYIHVTNPNLWILLAMIIAMLAGLIILGSTVTMENTMNAQAEVLGMADEKESTLLSCTLTGERRGMARIGMEVRVAGQEGTITELIGDEDQIVALAVLDEGSAKLKEGTYDAVIVLEKTTPLSFLLGNQG